MNLDELRSVRSKERQTDSLQNLRPSFYREVGDYIADLEDERDRAAERADDPFSSPEVRRLTDEIETARDVAEAIYERRMGKLVKQASLAAAGLAADEEGLTAEEADLFDDLVERIESNKNRVLDTLEEGDAAADAPDASSDDGTPDGTVPDPGAPASADSPDRTTADDAPPAPPEEPAEADPLASSDSPSGSGVNPADVMGGDGPPVDDASLTPPDAEPDGGAGDGGAVDDGPTDRPDPDGDPGKTTSEIGADPEPEETDPEVERTTVRIKRDVGAILGVDDREYTLTSDDVVALPEQNAAPLVEREAAERLE
jgi:DNA replication factor GINS